MNEPSNDWLARCVRVRGVWACGWRGPDHSLVAHTVAPDFPLERLEHAWRCVADTFQVLRHHRLPALCLRWTFEHALLFCLMRPEGTSLMVFTTRKPQDLDLEQLQALFDEFQSRPG